MMNNRNLGEATPFFCDLYHLTMANAWFMNQRHNIPKTSEVFYRTKPFGGGYTLSTGLGECLQWIKNWQVTDVNVEYLSGLKNMGQKPLFKKEFMDFLRGQKLNVDVWAVPEGEVLFPNEPAFRVSGPCWQVDMVEAAFLNIFNSQSLIATKSSRICAAATADGVERPVLEFGLRRAQEMFGFSAARAAYIGGVAGTSNVAAAQYYDIPVSGTMAHSFVMSYQNEIDAFRDYMRSSEGNAILLVDTYDTRQGIKNAICASKETGIALQGVRIDSGDLAYWYHEARRMFGEAGMSEVKLVASNDLDEYSIEDLVMKKGAKYDVFAAGTKLVTAYDCPALGGVYKTKEVAGEDKIKIAEGKTTIPGATDIIRICDNEKYAGDAIIVNGNIWIENGKLRQPLEIYNINGQADRRLSFDQNYSAYNLLKPVVKNGEVIAADIDYSLNEIRTRAKQNLAKLKPEYKLLIDPGQYAVGQERALHHKQRDLILANQANLRG